MAATMYESSPVDVEQVQPISRTYQYRKVMKPMLERKRRARINRCLDELKELMVTALQSDGENVAKLEKADILELTVRHLHKLRKARRLTLSPQLPDDRFRAGYTHCAGEVSKCLAATPGVDVRLGTKLMTHLGYRLNEIDQGSAAAAAGPVSPSGSSSSGPTSPISVRVPSSSASEHGTSPGPLSPAYSLPPTPASSRSSDSPTPMDYSSGLLKVASQSVWRPW